MAIETKLKELGLSENESRTYIHLLKHGDSSVLEVAKETGINRSALYFILTDLHRKGLTTYILKNNVRIYRPSEPEKLLDLLHEKEKICESILPDLLNLYVPKIHRATVEILEGKEGLATIFNDLLRIKNDWFAFNTPGKGPDILGLGANLFEEKRQKLGIKLRVLSVKTDAAIKRYKEFKKMKYTEIKFLPIPYESPASNWIYGDRFVIIFWDTEVPLAIRIIDAKLAESYKNYFNILWSSLKDI